LATIMRGHRRFRGTDFVRGLCHAPTLPARPTGSIHDQVGFLHSNPAHPLIPTRPPPRVRRRAAHPTFSLYDPRRSANNQLLSFVAKSSSTSTRFKLHIPLSLSTSTA
jgi:hypothetical protein